MPAAKPAYVKDFYLAMVDLVRSYKDVPKQEQDELLTATLTRYQICIVHRGYLSATSFNPETFQQEQQLMYDFAPYYIAALADRGVIDRAEPEADFKTNYSIWYNELDQLNNARVYGSEAEKQDADKKWWDTYRTCNSDLESFTK